MNSATDDSSLSVEEIERWEDYAFPPRTPLFRVVRAKLRHTRFDGRMSDPITRINFERGNSVAVLLHDSTQDAVVLVRQFMYPVYAGLSPEEIRRDGVAKAWILEVVAGVVDENATVKEVANKELIEESGYKVKGDLEPLGTLYPSPGGTSERIHLFLGLVDSAKPIAAGGGVVAEGEDIQVVVLPLRRAMEMVERGEIQDAKTIVGLQRLALMQAGS